MYVIRRTANRNGMSCVGFLKRATRLGCSYAPLGEAKRFKSKEEALYVIDKYCLGKKECYEVLEV